MFFTLRGKPSWGLDMQVYGTFSGWWVVHEKPDAVTAAVAETHKRPLATESPGQYWLSQQRPRVYLLSGQKLSMFYTHHLPGTHTGCSFTT